MTGFNHLDHRRITFCTVTNSIWFNFFILTFLFTFSKYFTNLCVIKITVLIKFKILNIFLDFLKKWRGIISYSVKKVQFCWSFILIHLIIVEFNEQAFFQKTSMEVRFSACNFEIWKRACAFLRKDMLSDGWRYTTLFNRITSIFWNY